MGVSGFVLSGYVVRFTMVDLEARRNILFRCKHYEKKPFCLCRFDDSLVQHLAFLGLFEFATFWTGAI